MSLRNQNHRSDDLRVSWEELRTAVLFWLLWSAYVCLSVVLIAALLTDWPKFLHDQNAYFR